MCEDTNLKAIHNLNMLLIRIIRLSSMCEDTNLKAIHNNYRLIHFKPYVVFNVRRY